MKHVRRALKFGLNKVLETPAILGSRIVAFPQIASRLDAHFEKTRRDHVRYVPPVADTDQAIIDGVRRNGVFVTSLEELGIPGTDHFLKEADALESKHLPLRASFQAGASAIMAHPQIYQWGLHGRLLDIAENYLGVPVGYDGLNIFFTKADGRENGVRRWHRDSEDRQMLKIAVYIHDVDDGSGPFQVLKRRIPRYDQPTGGTFP